MRQRSGIDTIKYHPRPRAPHRKVTKYIKTPHTREPRGQPFSACDYKAARDRQMIDTHETYIIK